MVVKPRSSKLKTSPLQSIVLNVSKHCGKVEKWFQRRTKSQQKRHVHSREGSCQLEERILDAQKGGSFCSFCSREGRKQSSERKSVANGRKSFQCCNKSCSHRERSPQSLETHIGSRVVPARACSNIVPGGQLVIFVSYWNQWNTRHRFISLNQLRLQNTGKRILNSFARKGFSIHSTNLRRESSWRRFCGSQSEYSEARIPIRQ